MQIGSLLVELPIGVHNMNGNENLRWVPYCLKKRILTRKSCKISTFSSQFREKGGKFLRNRFIYSKKGKAICCETQGGSTSISDPTVQSHFSIQMCENREKKIEKSEIKNSNEVDR